VGASERAAILEQDASLFAVQHQTSASVLNTVLVYWDLRSAQENLEIATRAVEFQARLITLTRASIAAGDLPGVELARAQAAESRSHAQERDAQKRLHQARVALAMAMGISATDDAATLPRAHDDFPQAPDTAALQQPVSSLFAQALDRRRDLGAAGKSEEAGRALEESARINLRPRIDLSVGAFFTALDESNFGKAIDRWVGPSSSI
jgi:outer membrane protein TolC